MEYFRPAEDRGKANFGWLDSKHSFSFGSYYDPNHMGISVLRVINDDSVIGGAGFDTHGHQDMEIISYVLEGVIEHEDSMGNVHQLPAGEVQRMSAGTGVTHSEYNGSKTDPLKFLQIWILPNQRGIKPGYEQARIEQKGALTPLVTPDGRDGSLMMHQDAYLYRLRLAEGEQQQLNIQDRAGYLHIVKGSAEVGSRTLNAGDALGVVQEPGLSVTSHSDDFEALWFDLPPVH